MALTSITKDFVIKAGITTEGTLFATTSTGQTGTLQVLGGAAIAKNLVVGTTATIWGNSTLVGTLNVTGYSQVSLLTATIFTATSANIIGNETVGGNLAVTGLFTATGASELGNTLKVAGNSLFNGAVNTFSGALFVTGTNIFTVGTGASALGGSLNVAGITSLTTNTTAANAGTGALVVTGGTYIGDNLIVKSTAWNTATNTANAIYTAGGIYADRGLTVAGPTLFKDIVTFNGTATYVLSTNTYYTDNLIELHTPPSGVYGQWTLDDGKDIGFRFHYYTNSTDTNAALVLDNATKYLDWYSAGAESTIGDFSSATFGTFRTGSIVLAGGTAATSTITGSLQITNGGIGVGGAVWANTLNATNLTTASGIVYSINNKLQNTPVTWNDTTQRLVGTIDLANTATNITGGAAGSLPYQTGGGATTMLAIGTNGYILTVAGGNPSWAPVSGLTAGLATTATNIAGGLKDQVPYQTAPGQTAFNAGMTFNGTIFTATNITVSGTSNSTGYNNNTGALIVRGGAAINNDLWVGGDINLQGSLFLKGVGLDQITGSTGTFDFLIVEGTGTALTVNNGVSIGGVTTMTSTTPSLGSATAGPLQVAGGVGIAKDIYVGTTATVAGALLATGTTPSLGVAAAGVIQATGGVGIAKDIYVGTTATVAGITFHNNITPSLGSATAGAVQTTGGVGIAKDIYVGTTATVAGTIYATSTAPALGGGPVVAAVEVAGGIDILKDIYVGTTATVAGSLAVTGFSSLSGGATISAATVTNALLVSGYATLNGGTTISAATVTNALLISGYTTLNGGATISAATVTNALLVSGYTTLNGGATISAATVTNTLLAASTTPSLGVAAAGAVQVTGGVGVAKDLYVGTTATIAGVTFHNNTTPTLASATAGAVQTTGGVGIAKDLYVGTTATLAGSLAVTGFSSLSGGATLSAATVTNALVVTGYTSLNGGATISAATVTNTLSVTGRTSLTDVSVSQTLTATNLVITGTATLPSVVTLSALTVTNLTVTNNETVGNNLSVANLFTATGASVFGSTISVTGIATFNSTQDSNATNNGSIVTLGGVGITKNLVVGSAVTIGSVSTQTVVPAIYSNNSLYSSYTSGYITTNAQATLDTYSASAYRTAKYIVQIVDGTKIHVEEILVFHDGTNVYLTEYAIATSQGELGAFDAALGGGTVTVSFTPNYTPTSMTIKLNRTTITL